MDSESIKAKLTSCGYTEINEYHDEPDEFFAEHNHPGEQLLVVIKGSMAVNMSGQTSTINAGGEFRFPAAVVHSARIGPKGCNYIVGEKPSN